MGSTCLDEHHDLQLALQYWRNAVQLRNRDAASPIVKAISKPAEHFNHAVEFQTLEELDNLSTDLDAMRTQSLLICERILGSTHKVRKKQTRKSCVNQSPPPSRCISLKPY
jgi:hypothetical protein